jgi:hypothetical protein
LDPQHLFSLTKWYLDCVDDAGRAAIAYWTALAWGGLVVRWQNVTLYEPGAPPDERSSLAHGEAPAVDGRVVTWSAEPLGCTVRCEAIAPAAGFRLLDDTSGTVDWHCQAPAGEARIAIAGRAPVVGRGYAERLVLKVLPWRLPIRELRWGRWSGGDRSLVWIDWRGAASATWLLADGTATPGIVSDTSVRAGGSDLAITDRHTLHERSLDRVLEQVPVFRRVVPERFRAMRECKWLSRGAFTTPDAAPKDGWALHELVVFP